VALGVVELTPNEVVELTEAEVVSPKGEPEADVVGCSNWASKEAELRNRMVAFLTSYPEISTFPYTIWT
jgi:hypothetical protein